MGSVHRNALVQLLIAEHDREGGHGGAQLLELPRRRRESQLVLPARDPRLGTFACAVDAQFAIRSVPSTEGGECHQQKEKRDDDAVDHRINVRRRTEGRHPNAFRSILPRRSSSTPSASSNILCNSCESPALRGLISPLAFTTRCHGTVLRGGRLCKA